MLTVSGRLGCTIALFLPLSCPFLAVYAIFQHAESIRTNMVPWLVPLQTCGMKHSSTGNYTPSVSPKPHQLESYVYDSLSSRVPLDVPVICSESQLLEKYSTYNDFVGVAACGRQ